ncbi:hydrogenase large subunit [Capillimicrobium parvum]|uniref:Formate hydrogenlyase subunit 5 n=1 Tax=Capillimicrobium parvum TaxID=2884022 RepID=A0A9E6XX35_9ACTN|nr:NADH-quinone oxidoreductase subunit C [Capillimicrobium parvum]UGS35785.1 Formate hydrogenlyase subunit 5 [Capillimicrobium parvum]
MTLAVAKPTAADVPLPLWRKAVAAALDGGGRFAGAYATDDGDELRWRVLVAHGALVRSLACRSAARRVPSVVDLAPAAGWDEREAHDLHGLGFDGHEPLRPLVDHPADPSAWTVPMTGEGVHDVAVGPIHAGVIESGHFRFHLVGERILALDARLFHKHRGLERAAQGGDADHGLAHVGRACAACHVASSVAYAQAVELAQGRRPSDDLRVARTLLLELERLYNHLNDVSAVCAGVGFAPGAMAFAALKERAQRLNARLTGHRFLFGSVAVGGSTLALSGGAARTAGEAVRSIGDDAAKAWRSLMFARSVQARLDGVGVLTRDDAVRLGAVGPAARASGVREDVRTTSPRLAYGDLAAAVPEAPAGDVRARLQVRALELESTCAVLGELLASGEIAPGGVVTAARDAPNFGTGLVESPRGATLCAVELDGDRVARVHLRTGSYANWPAVAHAAAGNLLPDFPLINKSFELCYACADR